MQREMFATRASLLHHPAYGLVLAFLYIMCVNTGNWADSTTPAAVGPVSARNTIVTIALSNSLQPGSHYHFGPLRLRGGKRTSHDTAHEEEERADEDSDLPDSGKISKKSKDRKKKSRDSDSTKHKDKDQKKRKKDDKDGKHDMKEESDESETDSSSHDSPKKDAQVSSFRISAATAEALARKNITSLFPIQVATFDLVYDGYDLIARARTGTGKTLGFVLPVHERLVALR
jgi:hypothetical protein